MYHAPPAYQYMHASTAPSTAPPSWDQAAFIAAMNNFTLNNHEGMDWIFHFGACSRMSSNMDFLLACSSSPFSTITIGDGSSIPISCTGHSYIINPSKYFSCSIIN
jgi:hypothetical protein